MNSLKSQNIIQSYHSCYSPNLYKMFYTLPQISNLLVVNNPYSRMTQNNSMTGLDTKDSLTQYEYEKTPI